MADANKTLITRAEITSITTPATNRKALVLDGATFDIGDTGMRDVSGLVVTNTVASGKLLVRRFGNVVQIIFNDLKVTAAVNGTNVKIYDLPSGFRAPYAAAEAYNTGATAPQGRVSSAGAGVYVQFANSTFTYALVITYITSDPWPSSLPGVADGTPIGV